MEELYLDSKKSLEKLRDHFLYKYNNLNGLAPVHELRRVYSAYQSLDRLLKNNFNDTYNESEFLFISKIIDNYEN
jgi:hypothetical protein